MRRVREGAIEKVGRFGEGKTTRTGPYADFQSASLGITVAL